MIGRFLSPAESESAELKSFDDFELRLGDLMRGERATMGKSLLDVQRELKIKATYIAAIENCDPAAFETPGFIAGYVRSYARYLGMDPEWAFATFCAESDFETAHGMAIAASPAKIAKAEAALAGRGKRDPFTDPNAHFVPKGAPLLSGIEPGALGSVVVLLGLIGLIGFGGWTVLQEVQRVQFAAADTSSGVATGLDPLQGAGAVLAVAPDDEALKNPSAEALDRLYRPEALDVPVLVARDGPIAAVDPASFGALAALRIQDAVAAVAAAAQRTEILTPESPPPVQVVESAAPEVILVAVRPAWVRVRGAGGTVLFEKVLDAGEEYILPQTEEAPTLRVGESGAVYFAINGAHYGPAGPDGVVTKDIVLSAKALTETYDIADMAQDRDLARVVAAAEAEEIANQ